MKQWQRRYRQLEGIDGSCKEQNYQVEQYDDWCHTARSILDLDVQYMSSKDYNKFNIETSFDILFNEDSTLEDDLDDDVNLDDMPIQTITIDPNDQEIIAALKSNNLAIKNGKLEFCYKSKFSHVYRCLYIYPRFSFLQKERIQRKKSAHPRSKQRKLPNVRLQPLMLPT